MMTRPVCRSFVVLCLVSWLLASAVEGGPTDGRLGHLLGRR